MTGASGQQPLETDREEQHVPCLFLEMHLQEGRPKYCQGPWNYFSGCLKNLPVCHGRTSVLGVCGTARTEAVAWLSFQSDELLHCGALLHTVQ